MKYSILFFALSLIILILFKKDSVKQKILESPSGQSSLIPTAIPDLVEKINRRNEAINSFSCDKISVKSGERGFHFKLNGLLHYQKSKQFRMTIASTFGEELDIGSNEEIFWYWSRRDPHPGVYWADYQDYYKTRLKTPFNPIFLKTSLGLDQIDSSSAIRVIEKPDKLLIVHQVKTATGSSVLNITSIDKKLERIEAYAITDMDGNLLATSEIQEFTSDGLPKKILYTWHEEKRSMLLTLQNSSVNQLINPKNWTLPNKNPKINMADEF